MSMKWMRGLYHYIIATFELKTETSSSAEADTCRVMVWCCTPTIQVAGAEVHYICINKTCYECEVGGRLNHKTHCDSYHKPTARKSTLRSQRAYIRLELHPYDH